MPINFRISALVPVGLIVESVAQLDDSILVIARAGIQVAICPLCGSPSRRVHSRYVREVSDLPCSGRSVRLRVVIRRYRCDTQHCRRRIFAERFDKTVLLVRSRRTSRLDCIVHHLGLALGGRPAASFAKRLMLPVSNDTVLRVVRARACPRIEPLNVVGIDEWAFRRNHSYGTIVCDLERRRIVTLLPDREMATEHTLNFNVAQFCKLAPNDPCRHHDALAFSDGSTIFINSLVKGQRVKVLQMPVTDLRFHTPQEQISVPEDETT